MKPFLKFLLLVSICLIGAIAYISMDIHQQKKLPDFAVEFSQKEIKKILTMAELPPFTKDETNRFSTNPIAIKLGKKLFFDQRLSENGDMSCATCHNPETHWTSQLPLLTDIPSLWNTSHQRWYFWDGHSDTLWGQAVGPLENPDEMNFSRTDLAKIICEDQTYKELYQKLTGQQPDVTDNEKFPPGAKPSKSDQTAQKKWQTMTRENQQLINNILINATKTIAAFEETIVSSKSTYHTLAEGLREKNQQKVNRLSTEAQKGLKIFLSKGQCTLCHSGSLFTDFEFHDIHLGLQKGQTELEPARHAGVQALRASPFNSLGPFSDDTKGKRAELLTYLRLDPESPGHFKTPSLINVEHTAPYMHDGRYKTLEQVIDFYSEMNDASPLQTHKERVVSPRNFTPEEKKQLLAFLKSLSQAP